MSVAAELVCSLSTFVLLPPPSVVSVFNSRYQLLSRLKSGIILTQRVEVSGIQCFVSFDAVDPDVVFDTLSKKIPNSSMSTWLLKKLS
jgi:hypothetical protein